MSAWIVSKKHIDYMVTAAIAAELIAPSKADETGRMLWTECLKSVAYRYPDDTGNGDRPGPVSFRDSDIDRYQWRETPVLTGGALLKTLGCYNYQSCEHPNYASSEALRLVAELEKTSGGDYDDEQTPWGWDDWTESDRHHEPNLSWRKPEWGAFVQCSCGWIAGWADTDHLADYKQGLARHLAHWGAEEV